MYSLSRQDVEAYLANHTDDEIIGIPAHSGKCLLANILRWKYPGRTVGVGEDDLYPESRQKSKQARQSAL